MAFCISILAIVLILVVKNQGHREPDDNRTLTIGFTSPSGFLYIIDIEYTAAAVTMAVADFEERGGIPGYNIK